MAKCFSSLTTSAKVWEALARIIANTLSTIGQPLRDEEIVSYMLGGLSEDYDPLVTSITTRTKPISLTDLHVHMLSYEMGKEHQNSAFQIIANNVTHNNQGGRDGSRDKVRNGNAGCTKQNFNSSSSTQCNAN